EDGWTPPVLLATARDGVGVEPVREAIESHRRHLEAEGGLAARRRRGRTGFVLEALEQRYGRFGLEGVGGRAALAQRIETSPTPTASLVAEIATEIEGTLRNGSR
ncbi:MAG: hypothetical protein VX574_00735, partial [Myxococcota bacterium]|nr:hypothetical protein [Myxococcota bacterium]